MFWSYFQSKHFLTWVHDVFKEGTCDEEMGRCNHSFPIPKKGGLSDHCDNWREISLLDVVEKDCRWNSQMSPS